MLKTILENKRMENGDQDLKIDVNGVQLNRQQLEQKRKKAIEDLAREKDPARINQAAVVVAQITSAIDALSRIDEAKAQAEPLRQQIRQEEYDFADQERMKFEGYLDDIVHPALDRLGGVAHSMGMNMDQKMAYNDAADAYRDRLRQMSFANAEKQAMEIRDAEAQGRAWMNVSGLPTPAVNSVDPNKIIMTPRPVFTSMAQIPRF